MSDGSGVLPQGIKFFLDGVEVEALPGETIWRVAHRHQTEIPHLCYAPEPGYRPDGNCRACMVEIEGERVLAASCIRKPTAGMKVKTQSERAVTNRKLVFELLVADQPARATTHDPGFEILGACRCGRRYGEPLPGARAAGSPIARIRRWRCISTPASSAISASAPAARCRSTT